MSYPVTTPFGQVAGYPLNNGFHNGIDYGFPMGTPVIVNGVTIGISNNTGATTGPHLHVGKYIGAQVQDPGVGNGFQFNSAVVYDTGYDSLNGNYVRVTGDGALWNYLHLESTLVTKGQVLQGDEMPLTEDQVYMLIRGMTRRDVTQDEAQNRAYYDNPGLAIETFFNNGGRFGYDTEKAYPSALEIGMVAVRDNWQQQITDLEKQLADLSPSSTVLKPGRYEVK